MPAEESMGYQMADTGDRERTYERTLLLRFSLVGLAVTLSMAAVLGYLLQQQLVADARRVAAEIAAVQVATAVQPIVGDANLSGPLSPDIEARLDEVVERDLKRGGIVRIKLWNADRQVVYSDDDAAIGDRDISNIELAEALQGKTETELSDLSKLENASERAWGRLLEVYMPFRATESGPVLGAYEIYQTTEKLDIRIAEIRATVAAGVFGGFAVLYVALFGVVVGAARRLVAHSRQNEKLALDIEVAYDETIEGWARALDLRDHETEGHSRRVTELSLVVAACMGMSDDELTDVRRGALLHDIGKMGVPDEILNKPGPLTDEEWVLMRMHPVYACQMLEQVSYLGRALDIPAYHHERWDGTGYPEGMRGEEIPLAARIFAVVDVWDALSFPRPYREAWPKERVLEHLRSEAGTHFDPAAVDAVFEALEGW